MGKGRGRKPLLVFTALSENGNEKFGSVPAASSCPPISLFMRSGQAVRADVHSKRTRILL